MNNLAVAERYTTKREDDQVCPVDLETDGETGEKKAKQKSAPFFLGTNRIIKPKCNLLYKSQLLTQY